MVFRVVVRDLTGKRVFIDLCDTEEQFKTITVLQLKEKIYEQEGTPPDFGRYIIAGKQLADDRLLCDYGIQHESQIHQVLKLRGGGPMEGDGGIGDNDRCESMETLLDI